MFIKYFDINNIYFYFLTLHIFKRIKFKVITMIMFRKQTTLLNITYKIMILRVYYFKFYLKYLGIINIDSNFGYYVVLEN